MDKLMHRRHDISDRVWSIIEPCLPGKKGKVGRPAENNRTFINAVLWVLPKRVPVAGFAPDYGNWNNVHRRFCRWRDKGVWESLLQQAIDEPDLEWLMIDASHIKVHPHGTGAVGGNQDIGRTKGGSIPRYIWPWMRLVIRSELLLQEVPLRIALKQRD